MAGMPTVHGADEGAERDERNHGHDGQQLAQHLALALRCRGCGVGAHGCGSMAVVVVQGNIKPVVGWEQVHDGAQAFMAPEGARQSWAAAAAGEGLTLQELLHTSHELRAGVGGMCVCC